MPTKAKSTKASKPEIPQSRTKVSDITPRKQPKGGDSAKVVVSSSVLNQKAVRRVEPAYPPIH